MNSSDSVRPQSLLCSARPLARPRFGDVPRSELERSASKLPPLRARYVRRRSRQNRRCFSMFPFKGPLPRGQGCLGLRSAGSSSPVFAFVKTVRASPQV